LSSPGCLQNQHMLPSTAQSRLLAMVAGCRRADAWRRQQQHDEAVAGC
jgi:hypothetical protein